MSIFYLVSLNLLSDDSHIDGLLDVLVIVGILDSVGEFHERANRPVLTLLFVVVQELPEGHQLQAEAQHQLVHRLSPGFAVLQTKKYESHKNPNFID